MTAANPYQAPRANLDSAETSEEYQPVKILSMAGRMGRVRYIGYSFGLSILVIVLVGLAVVPLTKAPQSMEAVLAIVIMVGYVTMIVLQLMLTAQRCHDFNVTGWLALLIFVPLGVFVFWFVPGTVGPNRWGYPPPPNTKGVVALALLVPVLIIVGILAGGLMKGYELQQKAKQLEQSR